MVLYSLVKCMKTIGPQVHYGNHPFMPYFPAKLLSGWNGSYLS